MKKCEKGFFKACSKFIGKAAKIGANDRCYGLHYQPKKPAALKNNPATQSKAVQASCLHCFFAVLPLWKNSSNRSYLLSAPYHLP